jgi:hypothetical protein
MGACHQNMARPHIMSGKHGLDLWTAAANIINKQSRTAEKGSPPPWWLSKGTISPYRKNSRAYVIT